MAFNPGGITYADPFGAFLTGNVIGREQNRADDQLAMQRAQEQRQQDQFDWTKALRPGQERMQALTIEEAAANNAQRALENREWLDFQTYRKNKAVRDDRVGEVTAKATEIASLPVARAQAAQADITQKFALPMAQAQLEGQQTDIAARNAKIQQTMEALRNTRMGQAFMPLAFDPATQTFTLADYQGGQYQMPAEQYATMMDTLALAMTGSGQQGQDSQSGMPADPFGIGNEYKAAPAQPAAQAPQPQPPEPAAARPVATMPNAAAMAPRLMPAVSEVPVVDPVTTGLTRRADRPSYVHRVMSPEEEAAYFRRPF